VPKKKRKQRPSGIDKDFGQAHTETMLQLSGNNAILEGAPPTILTDDKTRSSVPLPTLVDLRKGEAGILDCIDLPGDDARRLMELGFLPGARVTAGFSAPGGDPRVFQVDGSEFALRRETARRMKVREVKARHPRNK
jgi:Fe2+ transport system protein FeoA